MAAPVTVLKMGCSLLIPDVMDVSGDMSEKWVNSLTVHAPTINARRVAKIGDAGTYAQKVSGPSNAGFSPMVDAAFISRKGRSATDIVSAHAANGAASFDKWNANLDLAFADVGGVRASRFVDNVANKSANIEAALSSKTLRLTGDKIRGRGAAAIIANLLVGYAPAQAWLREGDVWNGGVPYNIVKAGMESALKAALTQRIIQSGLSIIMSKYDAAAILAQNTLIADLLEAMSDDTLTDDFVAVPAGGSSSVVFAVTNSVLTLETVITLTA